ncbi:MAG: lipase maturation factor family protein, partial [Sphingobacteriales bacterium]|nr:lipase maturation factor family protein [Sphingobacteriales bacterium]
IILFQFTIFISGNLSFLNLLTIIPALACFDDAFLSKVLPRSIVRQSKDADLNSVNSKPMLTTAWIITAVVALLSIQPVINLFSSRQIMNTSFEPFDLVNTYGAFGNVGKQRWNVVFEGTRDNDTTDKANWKPYVYKGLPVDPSKSSPQIAPYQLRLDWQMWFASMSSPNEYPWTVHLVWKLLHNDANAVNLFANNPFPAKPPKYIRAVLYRYSFAEPGNPQHLWWNRQRVDVWLPPLSVDDPVLHKFLKAYGWIP